MQADFFQAQLNIKSLVSMAATDVQIRFLLKNLDIEVACSLSI